MLRLGKSMRPPPRMAAMHVLIATTGVLSPEPVVEFTRQLLGQHGRVTVITVIEVPRQFLDELEGPKATTAEDGTSDASVDQYLRERGKRLVESVEHALEGARIPYDVVYVEGTDPAAKISQAAGDLDADIVVLGATRQIFNQDAWESVSARVMMESGRPVLVVPAPPDDSDDPT
jgi:nucleotide-binding universal stress UspA family protein